MNSPLPGAAASVRELAGIDEQPRLNKEITISIMREEQTPMTLDPARAAEADETLRERVAQLPLGVILLIVFVALVSYFLDARAREVRAEQNRPRQTAFSAPELMMAEADHR